MKYILLFFVQNTCIELRESRLLPWGRPYENEIDTVNAFKLWTTYVAKKKMLPGNRNQMKM
jgi:hypothetical protein